MTRFADRKSPDRARPLRRGVVLSVALHGCLGLLVVVGVPVLPTLFEGERTERTARTDIAPAAPTGEVRELTPDTEPHPADANAPGTAIEITMVPESSLPAPRNPGPVRKPDAPPPPADVASVPPVAALLGRLAGIAPALLADSGAAAPAGQDSALHRKRRRIAMERLERAARQGYAAGQYNLAAALLRGGADARTRRGARDWLIRAAENNHRSAQLLLGWLALQGVAAPPDPGAADFWWNVAARNGSRTAEQARAMLAPLMTADQIIRSRRRQAEWRRLRGGLPDTDDDGAASRALREAAAQGDVAGLLTALAAGADADGADPNGRTAMINAAWRGRAQALRILLDKGASLRAQDGEGRTPLIWAAINGHDAAVELLLDAGADPDRADRDGRTALMRAAWNGYPAIVGQLLDAGAQTGRRDRDGLSAEDLARREGRAAIAERLRRAATDRR